MQAFNTAFACEQAMWEAGSRTGHGSCIGLVGRRLQARCMASRRRAGAPCVSAAAVSSRAVAQGSGRLAVQLARCGYARSGFASFVSAIPKRSYRQPRLALMWKAMEASARRWIFAGFASGFGIRDAKARGRQWRRVIRRLRTPQSMAVTGMMPYRKAKLCQQAACVMEVGYKMKRVVKSDEKAKPTQPIG